MSQAMGQRIKRLEDRVTAIEAQMEVLKVVIQGYTEAQVKKRTGRPKKEDETHQAA